MNNSIEHSIFWSAEKSNTNVVREVFSGPPISQALGFAIVPEISCRAGKFTSRTLM
jgi:hypothetical protein